MKVAVVSQYFWPEAFIVNDLTKALAERGHEVVVLTGLPNYPSGRIADGYGIRGPWSDSLDGIPVARVPLVPRGSSKGARLIVNYASFAASGSVLAHGRVPGDVDVIFVFAVSPISAALPAIALRARRKTPVVLWVQDIWPDVLPAIGATRSPGLLRAVSWLTRWIYAHCDRVVASSEAFIPRIEAQGVPRSKISYLPNWAEPFYRPVDLEPDAPERSELPEGFRVLFAGNIGEAQAFGTILDAADRLRHESIHWVVLGDGRSRAWVEAQVATRRLQDVVHLLGRRPATAMPRYFALADALLVSLCKAPLYSWTVPSKLQVYMACARPIVAALDGEGARIVESSRSGLVAGAEDPGRLADAVLELARMPESTRQTMGARSLAYFQEHFERERVVDELERVLVETARGPR
jgi:glycosyltransferase involved in cell wall biosynthesis